MPDRSLLECQPRDEPAAAQLVENFQNSRERRQCLGQLWRPACALDQAEVGHHKVVALARAEFYSQDAYLGHENQAVEMRLELVPPKSGTRWYLQITHLNWNKIETFKVKKSLEEGVRK
jgi:hypothetical protein